MTEKEELLHRIQKMTKEQWQQLMVNEKLDKRVIERLEIIGKQKGWA